MAKLSQTMKDMIDNQFPFLATTSSDGSPQVGPKGSLHVLDDSHLIYYEHTFRHAYENLMASNLAAVAVVDRKAEKGFRFEGHAHIHENDEYATDILSKTKIFERFPRAAVVVIDVERIYKLDNTLDAGMRIG
ncbi:pyridoxamine 5'-phosphate oxidase family protein [Leuconostoc rapi]|uniref:pyridoxamine 5'-phosphate oxidase family protein n=1 Tax=Leuconostoc rapi TaxID=1406906 RepID=UPI0019577E7C|nr:pyridoxamine 5'-phosphate oxidase family protein [Leuconostoc rapi]MBM7435057.1 putative pyridoxine 5'-phosphate oxidase superfamily flavin-nucleotide-binding protein [Leuconostoc rapi]